MSVIAHVQGASPYGVIDMSGNVQEWCLTQWETDSIRLKGNNSRVLRGGSWRGLDLGFFRAADRYWDDPGFGFNYIGFRCARS